MIRPFPLTRLPKPPQKPYIQPSHRKAKSVTVGIATICDSSKAIVAVCDRKISSLAWSAELTTKLTPIHKTWWLMWSADDVTTIPPLIRNIKKQLWGKQPISPEDIADALSKAYQDEIRRRAEREHLGRFGFTMESFVESGRDKLTPESFDALIGKISQIELKCELMAFGFDSEERPHILTLHDPGSISFCEATSFGTIGSGQYRAESMLFFHEISWITKLPIALYHVCEAKFMSESAQGVGKDTLGVILQSHGGTIFLGGGDEMEKIRKIWKKHGQPTLPKSITKIATDLINGAIDRTKEALREARTPTQAIKSVSSPSPTEPEQPS